MNAVLFQISKCVSLCGEVERGMVRAGQDAAPPPAPAAAAPPPGGGRHSQLQEVWLPQP